MEHCGFCGHLGRPKRGRIGIKSEFEVLKKTWNLTKPLFYKAHLKLDLTYYYYKMSSKTKFLYFFVILWLRIFRISIKLKNIFEQDTRLKILLLPGLVDQKVEKHCHRGLYNKTSNIFGNFLGMLFYFSRFSCSFSKK